MIRLINTQTLQFEEMWNVVPPYAILSHTWGPEEVTYQEYLIVTDPNQGSAHVRYNTIKAKAGMIKIAGSCKQAAKDGLKYLWCDTNCIDKTSSSELSESINTMYKWYYDSAVCYAYLSDIELATLKEKRLTDSRWFTRGWTLQELLAPKEVVFFDKNWTTLGSRKSLAEDISPATLIHMEALRDRDTILDFSVAQRMSWAAGRTTTREEDIAYCLLGIFNINMSLIYGERDNAFIRLQEKIIRVHNDQSILAWDIGNPKPNQLTGALAPTPANFRSCSSIVRDDEIGSPFALTNSGVSMRNPMIKMYTSPISLVGLDCRRELLTMSKLPVRADRSTKRYRLWLLLLSIGESRYIRLHCPTSTLSLTDTYHGSIMTMPSSGIWIGISPEQFGSIRRLPYHQQIPIPVLRSSSSTGILISIGSGEVIPETQVIRRSYPFEDFSIMPLKARGKSTISHQLVANGNFVVIISVFWDQDGLPNDFAYSIIFDEGFIRIRQLAQQEEWACLFQSERHPHPTNCCRSLSSLRSLHGRLANVTTSSEKAYDVATSPLVYINRAVKDLLRSPEVSADVIFRECPTRAIP